MRGIIRVYLKNSFIRAFMGLMGKKYGKRVKGTLRASMSVLEGFLLVGPGAKSVYLLGVIILEN